MKDRPAKWSERSGEATNQGNSKAQVDLIRKLSLQRFVTFNGIGIHLNKNWPGKEYFIPSQFKATTLMPKLLSLLLLLMLIAPAGHAEEDPLTLLVDEYKKACHASQAEVIIPLIDEDQEPPTIFDPQVKLDPKDVYLIDITLDGKKATVLVAAFQCDGFGNLGCGVTGSCISYIIVDDQVFEWGAGGRPVSARVGDTVIVASTTRGYMCKDSDGREGFGAAPCYVAAVWDDEKKKFWSRDGIVSIRGDLSTP